MCLAFFNVRIRPFEIGANLQMEGTVRMLNVHVYPYLPPSARSDVLQSPLQLMLTAQFVLNV